VAELLADPVQSVDGAQRRVRVGEPDPPVETLADLAVVDLDPHRRDRQTGQRVTDDQRQLRLVVRGQLVAVDDVDVGLQELPVAALLRPLAPPHLLNLVAAERELQFAGVLQHVAGERHRQVEVQSEGVVTGLDAGIGLQPAQQVDLLGGLPLTQQLVQRLDRAGLQRREPVQLEGAAQPVDHVLLDHPLRGQPLREAGDRPGLTHSVRPRHSPVRRADAALALPAASCR
jgi:hypothetical protein